MWKYLRNWRNLRRWYVHEVLKNRALVKIDCKGFIDPEYEVHLGDLMPGVIESFALMRTVLDGMGYLTKA